MAQLWDSVTVFLPRPHYANEADKGPQGLWVLMQRPLARIHTHTSWTTVPHPMQRGCFLHTAKAAYTAATAATHTNTTVRVHRGKFGFFFFEASDGSQPIWFVVCSKAFSPGRCRRCSDGPAPGAVRALPPQSLKKRPQIPSCGRVQAGP